MFEGYFPRLQNVWGVFSYHLFRIGCHQSPSHDATALDFRFMISTLCNDKGKAEVKMYFPCSIAVWFDHWCIIVLIMTVITVRHERSTRWSQWSTIHAFPTSDMLIFSVGYDCYDYSTWWWLGTLLLLRCQKRGRWWWWRWKRQEKHWKYYFWREQLNMSL